MPLADSRCCLLKGAQELLLSCPKEPSVPCHLSDHTVQVPLVFITGSRSASPRTGSETRGTSSRARRADTAGPKQQLLQAYRFQEQQQVLTRKKTPQIYSLSPSCWGLFIHRYKYDLDWIPAAHSLIPRILRQKKQSYSSGRPPPEIATTLDGASHKAHRCPWTSLVCTDCTRVFTCCMLLPLLVSPNLPQRHPELLSDYTDKSGVIHLNRKKQDANFAGSLSLCSMWLCKLTLQGTALLLKQTSFRNTGRSKSNINTYQLCCIHDCTLIAQIKYQPL